jgi:hypothetical protein
MQRLAPVCSRPEYGPLTSSTHFLSDATAPVVLARAIRGYCSQCRPSRLLLRAFDVLPRHWFVRYHAAASHTRTRLLNDRARGAIGEMSAEPKPNRLALPSWVYRGIEIALRSGSIG